MNPLAERIRHLQSQIAVAAEEAGRDAADVTLVGVSKTWPLAKIWQAYHAGLRHFGENRTHELAEKRPALENDPGYDPADPIIWHFVGHLQSRQSQTVADLADLFHGADRLKILQRLGRQLDENGRALQVLLEVNVSGEATKGGFPADRWEKEPTQVDLLVDAAKVADQTAGLFCVGLMTMAPWGASQTYIKSVFARTRQLRDHLQQEIGRPLPVLSMGMSDDFTLAIGEGATHVRVGRAIFGERR